MNRLDTVKNVRGIYKVTNKINGKVYIGQSVDIGKRWRQHMTAKDDIYFHKAIQKYGVENFQWEIIEKCKKKDLDERESYWIEYYDSYNKGYNCTKGGEGVSGGEDHPRWKGGVSSDPEYNKQYYEANKEKRKEYYETNKNKIKEKGKEYYEANKEKRKEYDRQHREANKEKAKEYRETNKEKIKQQVKEWNEANKEKVRQYRKQYNEANKEKRKEYDRQYYINKKSMKNTLFN